MLVIYGICILLAVMSFVLSGTGQVYAFMGLAVAFGLGLFLLTRGESVDALEAESTSRPGARQVGSGPAARIRREPPGAGAQPLGSVPPSPIVVARRGAAARLSRPRGPATPPRRTLGTGPG